MSSSSSAAARPFSPSVSKSQSASAVLLRLVHLLLIFVSVFSSVHTAAVLFPPSVSLSYYHCLFICLLFLSETFRAKLSLSLFLSLTLPLWIFLFFSFLQLSKSVTTFLSGRLIKEREREKKYVEELIPNPACFFSLGKS